MTKEMRPAHRIDVLAHALVYYGMKTKDKLRMSNTKSSHLQSLFVIQSAATAHLLVARWRRAQQIYSAAEETFEKLAVSYEG